MGDTSQNNKRIAILIPCYNEQTTIAKVVGDCRKAFEGVKETVDIYVYDNNSTDETAARAEQAGAIVRRERRQGKGNVLRTMFRDIDADCYVTIDGDDTYPVEPLPAMCRQVLDDGVDMVIGDRLSTTYSRENKRPFHGMGNKVVRGIINWLFSGNVTDIMTGCRAMGRLFVKNMPILRGGFEIETEMTIHALDKNYSISSMPIDYRDRPAESHSKLNTFADGFKVLRTVFSLFMGYKPLVFFSWIALLLVLVATVMMIPVFIEYFKTGLVPRFPTLFVGCSVVVMAMLILVCGIILEVGNQRHRQLMEVLAINSKR